MSKERKLNIEESLNKAVCQAPSLDFEKLAAMPVVKMSEHDYITRQQGAMAKKHGRMPKYFKPVSAAVASCLVMMVCVSAWFVEFKTPDSVISLDANQSIEIVTNKHKQILSVKAFNQEAQMLLDEQDFDQGNLEDSVNVIISTMIQNGYLDDNKNVVMVSVENQSSEKANDLAVSLNQVIKDSATAQNVTTTVVMQSVVPDQGAVAQAEQYSVSAGKLNVMQEIAATDSSLSMGTLAAMSLTDLLEVSKEKSVDLTNIIQVVEENTSEDQNDTDTKTTETVTTSPPAGTNTDTQTTPVSTEVPLVNPIVVTVPETQIDTVTPEIKQPESVDQNKTTQEVPPPQEEVKEKSSIEKVPVQEDTNETVINPETQEVQQ